MSTLVCWNCGLALSDIPLPISRHATCSGCFNELHCCRLCRHYDPERTSQCFEDRADPPLQKENANFCDFFAPRSGAYEADTGQAKGSAKAELEALFGAPESEEIQPESSEDGQSTEADTPTSLPLSPEAEARRKLDDLLGD